MAAVALTSREQRLEAAYKRTLRRNRDTAEIKCPNCRDTLRKLAGEIKKSGRGHSDKCPLKGINASTIRAAAVALATSVPENDAPEAAAPSPPTPVDRRRGRKSLNTIEKTYVDHRLLLFKQKEREMIQQGVLDRGAAMACQRDINEQLGGDGSPRRVSWVRMHEISARKTATITPTTNGLSRIWSVNNAPPSIEEFNPGLRAHLKGVLEERDTYIGADLTWDEIATKLFDLHGVSSCDNDGTRREKPVSSSAIANLAFDMGCCAVGWRVGGIGFR